MTDPERARPREGRAMDERSAVCLLASLVAEREHPAEGAEDRLLAPAAGSAATFDGAHLLDESAYDGEQEIETQCPTDQLGHTSSLVCCRGGGSVVDLSGVVVRVAVLMVRGCPHVAAAVARAREAVVRLGGGATVAGRVIDDADVAWAVGMHGSPTVLVDRIDPSATPT